MANGKLKFFTQILLAIMLTTNSYVKYRLLHVMRAADDISRVKTGELHPDVLIATSLENAIFKKTIHNISLFCMVTYLEILHAALRHKYRSL